MSTSLRHYYRGANLVSMWDGATNTPRYYHFDHLGTTQCLTNSGGVVTDQFAGDAWGIPSNPIGMSLNRQWYVGNLGYYRQTDALIDYVRNRHYSPHLARWISNDYIPPRTYLYVSNEPTYGVDPIGLVYPPPVPGKECGDGSALQTVTKVPYVIAPGKIGSLFAGLKYRGMPIGQMFVKFSTGCILNWDYKVADCDVQPGNMGLDKVCSFDASGTVAGTGFKVSGTVDFVRVKETRDCEKCSCCKGKQKTEKPHKGHQTNHLWAVFKASGTFSIVVGGSGTIYFEEDLGRHHQLCGCCDTCGGKRC